MTGTLSVLLVEPYYAGSHRAWADGYAAASSHNVRLITLPASFWKWRMQGGFVTMAELIRAAVNEDGPPDAVVASSMTNLPGLLGAARPVLGQVPTALYMHENQLTYPLSPLDREDLTYAMVNWTSMTVADTVWFNSRYHHDAWFGALPEFLGRFPDQRHTHLIDAVLERSSVLPVGVDLGRLDGVPRIAEPVPLVLWNQRWEYDKGPAEFVEAVMAVAERGVDFGLAITGEEFVDEPQEFTLLRRELGDRIVHMGFADAGTYGRLLRSSDVVVSTARQEFFGIAITEAVYAGAFPVLPNRLVYPERIPVTHHSRCLYGDMAELVEKLEWALTHRREASAVAVDLTDTMRIHDWTHLAPRYDSAIRALVESRRA